LKNEGKRERGRQKKEVVGYLDEGCWKIERPETRVTDPE